MEEEVLEKEQEEKGYVPYGPTTFAELQAARDAMEQVEVIASLNDDFLKLAQNILYDEEVDDKAARIRQLAIEYDSVIDHDRRLNAISTTKEKSIGEKVINGAKKALVPDYIDPDKLSRINFYKNKNGQTVWYARYSNKWRDEDYPPEIISEASHLRFNKMVMEEKTAPFPSLQLWHVPGTDFGKATYVGYDNGFALAAGYVYPEYVEVADILEKVDGILLSHGMPSKSIKRDPLDESIIVEHETREISVLPSWAAANKLTAFVILKETEMEEAKNKGIPLEDRRKLTDDLGIPDNVLDILEQGNDKAAQAAEDLQLESKEVTDEAATEELEIVEEVEEVLEEIADEPEPVIEPQEVVAEPGIAETLAALKEAMTSLANAVENVQTEVQGIKEDQSATLDKMSDTPFASRAGFMKSIIGADEARVDGRTSLAKDGPEQAPTANSNHPLGGLFAEWGESVS